MTHAMSRIVLTAIVVCVAAAVPVAQQTTSTETKSFEVISVDGNQLVVTLPEGTRELTVPDDFQFNVDGQPMTVRELKAGMKGTATITTRTTMTPVTVTEVKNGTVVQRSGSTIIVRTADNQIKSFSQSDVDKRGVKIVRDGKPAEITDFREGDRLSATIITAKPPQVLTEKEVQATLARAAAPPPPRPAAAPVPAAPAAAAPAPAAPAAAAPPAPAPEPPPAVAARTLPRTASSWPLLGLVSALSLTAGLTLTFSRRAAR